LLQNRYSVLLLAWKSSVTFGSGPRQRRCRLASAATAGPKPPPLTPCSSGGRCMAAPFRSPAPPERRRAGRLGNVAVLAAVSYLLPRPVS